MRFVFNVYVYRLHLCQNTNVNFFKKKKIVLLHSLRVRGNRLCHYQSSNLERFVHLKIMARIAAVKTATVAETLGDADITMSLLSTRTLSMT